MRGGEAFNSSSESFRVQRDGIGYVDSLGDLVAQSAGDLPDEWPSRGNVNARELRTAFVTLEKLSGENSLDTEPRTLVGAVDVCAVTTDDIERHEDSCHLGLSFRLLLRN